jgi:hypothetical protein
LERNNLQLGSSGQQSIAKVEICNILGRTTEK